MIYIYNSTTQSSQLLEYSLKKELHGYEYNFIYCRNRFGKPYLKNFKNLYFNISHSNNITVCCIDTKEVGIDIEMIRPLNKFALKKVLSCSEKLQLYKSERKDEMFFKFWTLKESFVKNIGQGISYPLKSVEFEFDKSGKIQCSLKGFYFNQYILWNKFIISVCRR